MHHQEPVGHPGQRDLLLLHLLQGERQHRYGTQSHRHSTVKKKKKVKELQAMFDIILCVPLYFTLLHAPSFWNFWFGFGFTVLHCCCCFVFFVYYYSCFCTQALQPSPYFQSHKKEGSKYKQKKDSLGQIKECMFSQYGRRCHGNVHVHVFHTMTCAEWQYCAYRPVLFYTTHFYSLHIEIHSDGFTAITLEFHQWSISKVSLSVCPSTLSI